MKENVKLGTLFGREIEMPDGTRKRCNVVALLRDVQTGEEEIHLGANIVTNQGDKVYAQRGAGQTGGTWYMQLGNATISSISPAKTDAGCSTPIAVSGSTYAVSIDASYPTSNDTDPDNSLSSVSAAKTTTWRRSYTVSQANASSISEVALVNYTGNKTGSHTSANCLSHAKFSAAFSKTSTQIMKIFVNHTFNGV